MKKMIAMGLALCLILTGCAGGQSFNSTADSYKIGSGGEGVYNDDAKIVSDQDNFSATKLKIDGKADKDVSKVTMSFDTFNGKQQLFEMEVTEWEDHTVSYRMKAGEGSMKLMLVLEGQAFPIAETVGTEELNSEIPCAFGEGTSRLLLVCDQVKNGEAEISIDRGNSLSVDALSN